MEFISGSTSGLIVCRYQFSDREPSELAALFTPPLQNSRKLPPDLALLHAQCHAPQKLK